MKIILRFFLVIFFVSSLYADDLDDIRLLSPTEIIEKILDEYRYDEYFVRRSRFLEYGYVLTENPEKSIPVLFSIFDSLEMKPLSDRDKSFDIINHILWRDFFINGHLLNENEISKLCEIYQRNIDTYLKT
jgi:hypothetical protein